MHQMSLPVHITPPRTILMMAVSLFAVPESSDLPRICGRCSVRSLPWNFKDRHLQIVIWRLRPRNRGGLMEVIGAKGLVLLLVSLS